MNDILSITAPSHAYRSLVQESVDRFKVSLANLRVLSRIVAGLPHVSVWTGACPLDENARTRPNRRNCQATTVVRAGIN